MGTSIVNARELSKELADVLRTLPKTGPRLITRGGEVAGILIPPSGAGIETDLDLVARLRLGQALAATQREAVLQGTGNVSLDEIDREIALTRKARVHKPAK